MERKYTFRLITSLFLLIFLISCSPKTQAPLPKPETGSGVQIGQAISDKAGEWDNLLSLAKKEKRLSLYSVPDGALREALIRAMREKFGIDVDMVSGRTAELSVKLYNERKAGIFAADLYIGGGGTQLTEFKPAGMLVPVEPQLLLPEVLDPKSWWEGRLPFMDKDKYIFAFVANPSPPLAINTNLVSREEIKSYLDLLNSKWKGKMILNDPTTQGVAQNWFAAVSSRIMNLDYMKKLAQMDLTITRDQRLQVEWLTHGKFPVAIAAQQSTVSQFQKVGAPIELITPKEGTHVTSSSGNISIFNKAPHPYAAKLFLNWLLTREGQIIFSEAMAFQSARLDVPTSHLPPDSIRNAEVKHISTIDEEFQTTLPAQREKAREIFGSLMK